ncbi:DEAD/DEAH box helicase [Phocaeicola vulgatus]|uniref:DEAD/DEAH box helicase n=1 Tax=Phocaeicola vulgatus TaxID=821 RepID=UPI001F25FA33|nr:DEAD/DEAH box helicase [Phocaeicola vulgatus]MCE9354585.1 DEAD/DEAH box helicase [Phocaeicola vulgatus]MDU7570245.1 DEAD/DEAH box helicase [Bacteroides sp.]
MKFENIYKETEENMRLALLSLWSPGNHPMRPAIEELFKKEPLLAEPVFQSTFGWEPANDDSWRSALNPTVINKLGIGVKYPPYKHQAESWKTLAEGNSIVVTSGTGSGKTECFMYPVLSDLYEQGHTNAIEAIFLYPLNALMEDQKKRLSEYCQATGLHFAVYNGDTPEYRADGRDEILPNEVVTRDDIRDTKNQGTRPEILLTNPSMLEYILVRQKDQEMLKQSAGKLRWIVIDEAHSYSGSAAVELGYQIKRILDAFGKNADDIRFACTSATIGGEEGAQSLAEFISNVTGQSIDKIKVIGGKRLVKPLNENALAAELEQNDLPKVERVISLRNKINEVAGMTLQQMWEWLYPEMPFDKTNLLPALTLLDRLCEMSQGKTPVLSLRAHFFMRAISGLYACANENCKGVNQAQPIYGHLTTYKASVCPDCSVPLLEIVQCKRCGGFILMGTSDRDTHKIAPCDDGMNRDDYFAIDLDPDQEDLDEQTSSSDPSVFFLLPYEKEKFFIPINEGHHETLDIKESVLSSNLQNTGKWVSVAKEGKKGEKGHSYCPSCGKLAQGQRLNFKHFRIPINFINQTISPVFLRECAPKGHTWGKYIAFTDSRQGTAISAKTFNINVERQQCNENIMQKLAELQTVDPLASLPEAVRLTLTPEQTKMIIDNAPKSPEGITLEAFSNEIYNHIIFDHLTASDGAKNKNAYKASLMRGTIARRPAYETNAETMGLFTLVYPGLKNIKRPATLVDYLDKHNIELKDQDWQDYLKLCLDYFVRLNNHIQPLVDDERKYVRDSNISTPFSAPDDKRENVKAWQLLNRKDDGTVSHRQPRIVIMLCAGLKIHNLDDLQKNANVVEAIVNDAFNQLVDNKILTKVKADDTDGYNNPNISSHADERYVGCYFLDLSGREGNNVCRIKRTESVWLCPVTNQLLDTTFCGYSPLIVGEFSEKLFESYLCSEEKITMPCRPKDNDEVPSWMESDENVKNLIEKGLWSDRHKYTYKKTPAYIAAEHSAQQSKKLLRDYTKSFSQQNPSINVLHCSTTMEMGVDIGDIDVVLMDTVPPTAANYLQRVGRAGRMGQSKAIAFSLCNNTPVGQHAFDNPMWALQTTNHMIKVRPSQTIIQRHVNSFFFRQFICDNGTGIQANISIDEFMSSTCDTFIDFLNDMSTNTAEERKFHEVFGSNAVFSIGKTIESIAEIKKEYDDVMKELTDAFNQFANDQRRQMAISNQIRKSKSESLLNYLSEHQFIPNANMPTGVVTFDFTDRDQSAKLHRLFDKAEKLKNEIAATTSDVDRFNKQQELNKITKEINDLKRATSASRDIHTALNEYAPEQTVVVNEKNYVSAGVTLFGAYNEETQTRAIYHCTHCGHTDYRKDLSEGKVCPVCQNPYHGIIDRDNGSYTLAYEPVGFRTDQNVDSSREEKTEKRFYDIRPVLLKTDWNDRKEINMCQMVSSGESGNILFYNVGNGHGFAFCKRCGRAAVEFSDINSKDTIPYAVRPGHKRLWGEDCEANDKDIARHVVFTGNHPTCYVVLRFKKDAGSSEFENDEQLVYSLGVVLKRALALSEGIDGGEVDFGIKQEIDSWVLFIYDTAKGGCGYSLKLMNPVHCQEIFDVARKMLEESACTCHVDGGACAKCLVDRNNYCYANLLSKAKVLDWLNRQKNKALEIPQSVKNESPNAKVVYLSMKAVLQQSIADSDVKEITLCVSDITDDTAVTDWSSVRSEMGKYINRAVTTGKTVNLNVEYHPKLYSSITEKLPFINLKDKFPDCNVQLVKDMGEFKTAIVVKSDTRIRRYFTEKNHAISFSNNWGKDCSHIFVDENPATFAKQDEPTYVVSPNQVVREGLTDATMFQVRNYFSHAIAPSVLKKPDIDMMVEVLGGKHVDITFSDMYVNSALASLMLVYLIDEMKKLFGFTIDNVTLQLDSPKRKCNNDRFSDWTYINMNFESKDDADEYTDNLFNEVLGVDPEHSFNDADHHRWLKIETADGGKVEIRPDHGISGGYKSNSKYMNLDSLNGSVNVTRNNEDVLYYVIIQKAN